MRTKAVPIAWLLRDRRRLDCGPYMSGALEAKLKLETLRAKNEALRDVCMGGSKGIINPGRIKRLWVKDPKHGRRFLSSTDILKADLSDLELISNRAVRSNPKLLIKQRWTLITRAGTIGRMAYSRQDMDGLACSEDVLRVVPDDQKIPPGYLYAYLSSKFGVPIVIGGTYGSIIQHIEPEHIADLPVPRLASTIENQAHELVEQAARLRVEASEALRSATSDVERTLSAPEAAGVKSAEWVGHSISSRVLAKEMRFEGFFYNPAALQVDRWAESHRNGYWLLGDVADVFDVPPFKHIYVEAEYGVPFFTSGDLFRLERIPEKHLSGTRTRDLHKYILKRGWVLLARSGQLGGILGRPQFADSALDSTSTSDHVIRIVAHESEIPAGYLYAYLATEEVGYVLLTRQMTGASIPALWPSYLKRIRVVKAARAFRSDIHERVVEAFEKRVRATASEAAARSLVEQAIEAS